MATTVTEKSTTGLDANLAGLLCYAGIWVTGIIFLVLEKDSRFVKFHAMQSLITFLGLAIFWYVCVSIPFFGWIVAFLAFPFTLVLWIFLMVKAYNGEKFKLPIVGDIAEQQANK